MLDDERVQCVFYSPVRGAVSQHLAATCSGFLVKNSALVGNVSVSPHIGRSRDFIHETFEAPACRWNVRSLRR